MAIENQLSLYEYYVEGIVENRAFSSPFRPDPTPSFSIYEDKGNIVWMDHAFSEHPQDLFELIRIMNNNCSRLEAHKIYIRFLIDGELEGDKISNLGQRKSKNKKIKNGTIPKPEITQDFDRWELAYWTERGITRDMLIENEVYVVRGYFWEEYNAVWSTPQRPVYYYKIFDPVTKEEAHKVYSPTEKGVNKINKWRSWDLGKVLLETYPEGKNEEVIICSSRKDMMQAKRICGDAYDYGSLKSESAINALLKWYQRDAHHYKRVFYLGDFDFRREGDQPNVKRGIERMLEVEKKSGGDIISLIPEEGIQKTWHNLGVKDIDDMVTKFKINWTRIQIRELFKPYY